MIIFAALLAYAAMHAFKRGLSGDALGIALFASLTAFLVVGVVDSLIDEIRIGFLFFLLLSVALTVAPRRNRDPVRGNDRSRRML